MRTLAFAVLAFAACTTQVADPDVPPETPETPQIPETPETPPPAPLASVEVTFPSGDLELHGYLWVPNGPGPFPTFVYNHGSDPKPGDKESIGRFFAERGWILFVPHRRGHGKSPGDYAWDNEMTDAENVAMQDVHNQDVLAAIAWIKQRPDVDLQRLVVGGCSFGGIQTLLTAEKSLGLRAAVDWAGASMSWAGNADLGDRLRQAVSDAKVPVFFLQAENDYNITPTKELSRVAGEADLLYKAEIFPAHGTTPEEGHGGFCSSPDDWGDEVLAFLATHAK